jgi:hypothetical protein
VSYQEAKEDNVKFSGNNYCERFYYPKCECGNEVPTWSYQRGVKYICKSCKLKRSFKDKEKRLKKAEIQKKRNLTMQ